MLWGSDKKTNDTPVGDGAGDSGRAPAPAVADDAAKPLSLLAKKLGALEQSLTVVASEIGVSGMPQFKHLDADKVYAEAMRVARQAASEERQDIDGRVREAAAATAVLGVRLDSEMHGVLDRIDDLATRLDGLTQLTEGLRHRLEEQRHDPGVLPALQQRIDTLENRVTAAAAAAPAHDTSLLDSLTRRLDMLEQRATAQTMSATPAPAIDTAVLDSLTRRLDTLEQRATAQAAAAAPADDAEWPFADDTPPRPPQQVTQPATQPPQAPVLPPDFLERQREIIAKAQRDIVAAVQREIDGVLQQRLGHAVSQLEAQLVARIDKQVEQIRTATPAPQFDNVFADPPAASIAAANVQGLPELIATELAVLLARKAERNEQTPLLAERPGEINPLVMTAAERAIVRLTHRIEKLESHLEGDRGESRRPSGGVRPGSRSSRNIVGRLFEG